MILLKLIESHMINSNLVKNSTIHGIIRLKHYNELKSEPAKRNIGFSGTFHSQSAPLLANEWGALCTALLARFADCEEQRCKINRIFENTQILLPLQRTPLCAIRKPAFPLSVTRLPHINIYRFHRL